MKDGLYRSILDQLSRLATVKAVMLMLQNEPLLDRKFFSRVHVAKDILGKNVRVTTVTNGTPLTSAMISDLAASGIDRVSVSIDAMHERTYKAIRPGLRFQMVRENTLSLLKQLGPQRIEVRFLRQRQNRGEEADFARFWRSHGVRVLFLEPTNRAGFLDTYEQINNRQPEAWKKLAFPILNRLVPACPLPFHSLNVLWDGRVITCCHDWGPLETVGDLATQQLKEIWNGERLNHCRDLLWTHNASESPVCAKCSMSDALWKV